MQVGGTSSKPERRSEMVKKVKVWGRGKDSKKEEEPERRDGKKKKTENK